MSMIHRRFTRLKRSIRRHRLATAALITVIFAIVFSTVAAVAHPLGNFTINHFARIQLERERIGIHYVVDMAEISTFQELQLTDTDGDGKASSTELSAYLERVTPQYADGIVLTRDGSRITLKTIAKRVTTLPGAGGLPTLRVECDFAGAMSTDNSSTSHRLSFEDTNHRERLGWREIVVAPAAGVAVFNSSAFGNAVTNELRAYPQDMLAAPLDERTAQLSWTTGAVPADAVALRTREGNEVAQSRDQLAELIAVPKLTPKVALLGLLVAAALGALHAFSPGHGKTVVGAYLVGSRGTPRHAAFLGLTVTITHTLGVFALGLVTLFASQYVVPDRLFPILSFVSGGIVAAIGFSLFVRRLYAVRRKARVHEHTHDHIHHDDHAHEHSHHNHVHGHPHEHLHGGRSHSHLPPGADGTPVTWRNLLALGISGGLLPCPSALVVLLSAIALHRVSYGLLLVVAFSIGLAATLTAIGLAFVYAGSFVKRSRLGAIDNPFVRLLPVVSAFVIMCIGAFICYEAITQVGLTVYTLQVP
jgi:ABC-type nickel/cobalt efflux system permease component RcnA